MKFRFNALDPITLHLSAFFLFMVVPPLFYGSGYHFEGFSLEIVGLFSFIVGALLGKIYCELTLKGKKLYFDESKTLLCLLSFLVILWPIRLMLLQKYGIIALLHPFSRPSSLLDTISQQLSWPYIIFLMVSIIQTKARWPKALLTLEIIYFILPTLSRSYIVLLVAYFFVATLYYKRINIGTNLKKILFTFNSCIHVYFSLWGQYECCKVSPTN
ncbi:hypothetical protein OAH85_12595 [Paracoccaceae bacterium]|nr:hypothetical protein [Paracoccaceae bacterium]